MNTRQSLLGQARRAPPSPPTNLLTLSHSPLHLASGDVWFRGAARDVVLSSSGLDIIADPVVHIPLTELLSVRAGQVFRPPFCYSLVLKVVGRSRRRRKACNWFVQTLELRFRHNDICQHWITAIQGFMDAGGRGKRGILPFAQQTAPPPPVAKPRPPPLQTWRGPGGCWPSSTHSAASALA